MKKYLFIILILISFENSNAQKYELGSEIGYGRTYFSDQLYFGQFFEETDARNITAGINASFRLDTIALWLNTGFVYQQMRDNGTLLNYLRVPLGFDITPGRKLRFIIGSGLYVRYLFLVSGSVYDKYKDNMHDFQVGLYVDTGVKYQITDTWNIYLKMQADFDMSTSYTASLWHHGDTEYQDVRTYGYTLNIGCKYKIR